MILLHSRFIAMTFGTKNDDHADKALMIEVKILISSLIKEIKGKQDLHTIMQSKGSD